MKILLLDLEISYKIGAVWGLYNQNIASNQLLQDYYVLSWAAKWLGDKKMHSDALFKHTAAYKKDPYSDREIMKTIWKLVNEADIVIAHNGAKFDIPILNARFLTHGMQPPTPYKVVDTLGIARRQFNFTSNRLDDLGKQFNVGRKIDTGGFELWRKVVQDKDLSAFKKMLAYNEQDVLLLEKVYNKLKPWDNKHPSSVIVSESQDCKCNVCGANVVKNGSYATNTQVYQKYKCMNCGHNMRGRKGEKKNNTLVSI